jgi:hypothetical protein
MVDAWSSGSTPESCYPVFDGRFCNSLSAHLVFGSLSASVLMTSMATSGFLRRKAYHTGPSMTTHLVC